MRGSRLRHVVAGPSLDRGNGLAPLPDGGFMMGGFVITDTPVDAAAIDAESPCETLLGSVTGVGFVSRHHPDGSLSWLREAQGGSPDRMVRLPEGGVVVTGRFQGTMLFAKGTPDEIILESAGKQDVFVARYEDSGAFSWAFGLGGPGNELALGLVATEDGFVLAGDLEETVVFDGAPPVTVSTEAFRSAFLARCSSAGELQWVRQAAGSGPSTVTDLAGGSGALVITGDLQGTVVLGQAENAITVESGGAEDAYVARYTTDGAFEWVNVIGSQQPPEQEGLVGWTDRGDAVAIGADGEGFLAGEFESPITLGAGEPNEVTLGKPDTWHHRKLFLAAFNSSGELQWAKGAASTNELDAWHVASELIELPNGSLVLAGELSGDIVIDQVQLWSEGNFDVFLARFDANGGLQWAKSAGGTQPDYSSAMALQDGSLLLLGQFQSTAAFPLGQTTPLPNLTSAGAQDVFAARILP